MVLEHESFMVWAWMLCGPYALGTRKFLWFGHECFGDRMQLGHGWHHSSGTDALVTVRKCSSDATMVWAWMGWLATAGRGKSEGHGPST